MNIKVHTSISAALTDIDLAEYTYKQIMEKRYKDRNKKHVQQIPSNISCDVLVISIHRLLTECYAKTHTEQLELYALEDTDIKYINKYVLLTDTVFRMIYRINKRLQELISAHNVQKIYFKKDCEHTKYLVRNSDSNYYLNSLDVISGDDRFEMIEANEENIKSYIMSKLKLSESETSSDGTVFHKSPVSKSRPILNYIDVIDVSDMGTVRDSLNKTFGYCVLENDTYEKYTERMDWYRSCKRKKVKKENTKDTSTELVHYFSETFNVRNMLKSLKLIHDSLSEDINVYFEQFDTAMLLTYPTLYNVLVSTCASEDNSETDPYTTPYKVLEYPEDRPFDNISLEQKAEIINNFVNNTAYYQCINRTDEIALVLTFIENILSQNETVESISEIEHLNRFNRVLLYEKHYEKDFQRCYEYTYNSIIDFGDGLMLSTRLQEEVLLKRYNVKMKYVNLNNFEDVYAKSNCDKSPLDPTNPYINNPLTLTFPLIFSLIRTHYGEILDINSGTGLNYHPVSEWNYERLLSEKLFQRMEYISEIFYSPNGKKSNGLECVSYSTEYEMLLGLVRDYNKIYAEYECKNKIQKGNCRKGLYKVSLHESLFADSSLE